MLTLSTEDIPRHQRLAFVHDVVGRHAAGMSFDPVDPENFRASFSVLPLEPGTVVGEACYDAFTASRSSELLADRRDSYQLLINQVGFETEIEGDATLGVGAGDMLTIDQTARFVTRAPASRYEVIVLPRRALAPLVPGLGSRPFRKRRADAPGLGLLAGYSALLRRSPPATEDAARLVADQLLKLAALVLAADAEEAAREHVSAVYIARLGMLKRRIADRLDDPELSLPGLARSHGISPRYVQKLFAQEGTSFSDFLREQRLARARRRLDEVASRQSIADIAFDAGFSDLSTFNRAFRRRYGCTPSDIRAQAACARPTQIQPAHRRMS